MYNFNVDFSNCRTDICWQDYQEEVTNIHKMMEYKQGLGSEYTGWLDWPNTVNQEEITHIKRCAKRIRDTSDILLICGVGGSYLGAMAGIEMIKGHYAEDSIETIFVGNTFSSTEIIRVLQHCKGKSISCNVISKSGQTTETACAFRIIRKYMEACYGEEECRNRIYVTTDRKKGLLRPMAERKGYETFDIPDDIGGRFSVLTPVGLLPMAAAGVNIDEFIQGVQDSAKRFLQCKIDENDAYKYAVLRNYYIRKGYISEMFVTYEPHMRFITEWLKQLFGESEGKNGKGLLPHAVTNSTDLHSMGQFIQEGTKCLFETVLFVEKPILDMSFPEDDLNEDAMNYLADKSLHWINHQAFQATVQAHVKEGEIPNIIMHIPDCSAYIFGYVVYFFFRALAMSAYMLGVNPFDQPGVEVYKQNMYRLLKKPGYEF